MAAPGEFRSHSGARESRGHAGSTLAPAHKRIPHTAKHDLGRIALCDV